MAIINKRNVQYFVFPLAMSDSSYCSTSLPAFSAEGVLDFGHVISFLF